MRYGLFTMTASRVTKTVKSWERAWHTGNRCTNWGVGWWVRQQMHELECGVVGRVAVGGRGGGGGMGWGGGGGMVVRWRWNGGMAVGWRWRQRDAPTLLAMPHMV